MEIGVYLQHIKEVVTESPTIVVYLIAGLLLLFAGLYVFKGVIDFCLNISSFGLHKLLHIYFQEFLQVLF